MTRRFRRSIFGLALFALVALYWSQSTVLDTTESNPSVDFEFPEIVNPQEPFEDLRRRYLTLISEANEYSVAHPPIRKRSWQDRVDHIHANALHHYYTLDKHEYRTALWEDISELTSSNLTATFYRIGSLAQAWATPSGPLYHNQELLGDVLTALRWLVQRHYNPSITRVGNWWDWQIGIPYQINDLVALFYNVMDADLRTSLTAASRYFIPEPIKTGANRVWTCKIIAVRGILDSNQTELDLGSQNLQDPDTILLDYVESGDGFYRDGSFIQHDTIPYHGGYGKNLFKGLADIIYLLHGSAWELKDKRIGHIYEWAVNSFMPIVWRGALFANLRGREISRKDGTDYHAADDVITGMLRLIQIAKDEKFVAKLKSWVKFNIASARPWHDYLDAAPGSLYRAAADIIHDKSVIPLEDLSETVWMKKSDRAFMLRSTYALALSMSSDHVSTYECLNHGNLKGWYTGSGMTLLYNDDLGQYNDGYWATADMYHVPGVTAHLRVRKPCSGSRYVSQDGRTYGSTSGQHASIGMKYLSWGRTVNATKSWFFLDNEIVCLGAGISGIGETHTTIDQRQILSQRRIYLDDIEMPHESTFNKTYSPHTLHTIRLQSNVEEASDIAYNVYHVSENLILRKDDRTGSWIDVNNGHVIQDTTPFQRKYVTLYIDHGDSPVNASYIYSIRPKPELIPHLRTFQVLSNTEAVQAVQSVDKRVTGAVFYGKAQVPDFLTASTACSITLTASETDGYVKVAIELPATPDEPAYFHFKQLAPYHLRSQVDGITVLSTDKTGIQLAMTRASVVLDFVLH
ncbi:hypothetical protein INT44_001877 [Umbelopsis vinacea]|uniref:Chondroitin AC lyase n=1 Tax=Umbelopsis vinacea TaxID=44442 RepID=A0A8H7PQQ9_9FUNG|nr:hypothetical protein INT44_001877 [Umbelopsis vinacea]